MIIMSLACAKCHSVVTKKRIGWQCIHCDTHILHIGIKNYTCSHCGSNAIIQWFYGTLRCEKCGEFFKKVPDKKYFALCQWYEKKVLKLGNLIRNDIIKSNMCKRCPHQMDTHDMNCIECCPIDNAFKYMWIYER